MSRLVTGSNSVRTFVSGFIAHLGGQKRELEPTQTRAVRTSNNTLSWRNGEQSNHRPILLCSVRERTKSGHFVSFFPSRVLSARNKSAAVSRTPNRARRLAST
jgi:hypothetical protein